jgi:hypothetical protein
MVQLNTYNRAILAIGSPDCDIPNPALLIVENDISFLDPGNIIACTGAQFVTKKVKAGDIVYCFGPTPSPGDPYTIPTQGLSVVKVLDEDQIVVNNAVNIANVYIKVYSNSVNGCVICMTDASSTIQGITTIGGDYIDTTIYGPGGLAYGIAIPPIQVKKVESSSTPFIALW